MAELDPDRGQRVRVDELDRARAGGLVVLPPEASTPGVIRPAWG